MCCSNQNDYISFQILTQDLINRISFFSSFVLVLFEYSLLGKNRFTLQDLCCLINTVNVLFRCQCFDLKETDRDRQRQTERAHEYNINSTNENKILFLCIYNLLCYYQSNYSTLIRLCLIIKQAQYAILTLSRYSSITCYIIIKAVIPR